MDKSVLLIGCGNMGYAMLQGWLESGLPATQIHVVEPDEALRNRAGSLGVHATGAAADLPAALAPAIVVVAVKPQVIGDVLPAYRRFADAGSTILSIAAGTLVSTFEQIFGADTAVIRCMPNTPAAIGKGMMVCFANGRVSNEVRAFSHDLLASSGKVAFVDDEALMDAVTGVSGSGPAYVFHFIECLTEAGIAAGLPAELAAELALQTVCGSALLAASSEDGPAELRAKVTSPNGTTAAALDVLMGGNRLQELLKEAVMAATRRSRELANS